MNVSPDSDPLPPYKADYGLKPSENSIAREVVKWILSLDLTWQFKNAKWDLSNGYLVAEILSWYFPHDIQMHNYNNGNSLDSKTKNWSLLRNFFKRHRIDIPELLIDGTIHCREDAAVLLVEKLYEILTNRKVKKKFRFPEIDFSDQNYQLQLPIHCRATATQAVKRNLKATELKTDMNFILHQQKSQAIIDKLVDRRIMERIEAPERFRVKRTLGDICPRKAPAEAITGSEYDDDETKSPDFTERSSPASKTRTSAVSFKYDEQDRAVRSIKVNQHLLVSDFNNSNTATATPLDEGEHQIATAPSPPETIPSMA